MDLDAPVEVTIGPYETYEDGLFGYKAAFEAFVTVNLPKESAALARYKERLPWLERNLPIPDEHKNPNRGTESPIRVVDTVYTAGDTRAGVQTIAFNLPNDERVREAKGSKKVLLRNTMRAKYDQILMPIAERVAGPGPGQGRHLRRLLQRGAPPRAVARPRPGHDHGRRPQDRGAPGAQGAVLARSRRPRRT